MSEDTMIWDMLGRKWVPPDTYREPIMIHPDVRTRLIHLLFESEMRGVGYSEFISRACDEAEKQIRERRSMA